MCSFSVDDYCSVWVERWIQKSRKRHRCDACRGFIETGGRYLSHFNVYDGMPQFEKVCEPCADIREEFEREHGAQYQPSSTADQLQECIENPEDFAGMLKWSRKLRAMEKRREAAKAVGS